MHPPKIRGTREDEPTVGGHLPEEGRGLGDKAASDETMTGPRPAEGERPACVETGPPLPPGQHPYDPVKKDLDPIGFALYRVQTFLVWIDEHRAAFEKARDSDEEFAEAELSNLRDSTLQGMIYLQRLSELLLAGYTIDPGKRLPESLRRGWFASYVKGCGERGHASDAEGGSRRGAAAHPSEEGAWLPDGLAPRDARGQEVPDELWPLG
jgi:hypothetical protein